MPEKMEESKTNEPGQTARDPVCGMTVDKATALKPKSATEPTTSVRRAASPPLKRTQPNSLNNREPSFLVSLFF